MFTRKPIKSKVKKELRLRLDAAKDHMWSHGWSQRRAARELGVTATHLNLVLNGVRESRRLMAGVMGLPLCPADQIPCNSVLRRGDFSTTKDTKSTKGEGQ